METDNKLKNELKSLKEIFDDGNRVFSIPDYQRGYSWEEQQRKDLLKDIEYLIKSGYQYRHYTGTIVASLNDEKTKGVPNEYEVFDIVDGQQRMTSIILLLSVICRSLKEPTVTSNYEHSEIFSKFIQSGPVGNTVRKLCLGKEQDILFEHLVTGGITSSVQDPESKSDKNLIDAVRQYDKWLERHDVNKDNVLKCVCENLGFLLYAPENDKELGIMFEVINNRGKALTELEKIKNYLIYYADKNDKPDIRKRVNHSWPIILKKLNKVAYTSNESEDRFLRNCWIVFMDTNKSTSHHVYDGTKKKWPPDQDHTLQILNFIGFLENAAAFYVKYLKREGVSHKEEKKCLERISCHPADASITPLILAIFSKVTDQNERADLFELLEKLNFRFYGTGIAGRSDSGQGELFDYANTLFNFYKQEKDGEIIDVQWLKNKLTGFIDQNANDKKFVEYLTLDKDEAGDYYTWVGLKFFLASYEEWLRKEQKESADLRKMTKAPRDTDYPGDFYHREHIWAKQHFTKFDDSHNLNVNKRRLGNFLLLKEIINIKVSNKPPEDKIKRDYFKDLNNAPNTLMIRELKQYFNDAEKEETMKYKTPNYWYKVYQRFLDKREEKMINFALERWRVSALGSNISEVKLDSLADGNEIHMCTYTTETDNSFSQQASDLPGSLSGPEDSSTSAEHMAGYG